MAQSTMIITGASKGLGAAIASIAAEYGVQVVLVARSLDLLNELSQKIRQKGGTALAVQGDISKHEDCNHIMAQTLKVYGRIDALVNNAAVIEPFDRVVDLKPAEWNHIFAVNVLGPLIMCQLAIPHLRKTHGRIVNISSGVADMAIPAVSAYAASKAALNRLSMVLAVEEPDLTVTIVNPGALDTPMQAVVREKSKGKTTDEIHQFYVDLFTQGHLLPPEQSALSIVGLALKAPHEWSGEILQWDEARVQELRHRLTS